MASRVFIYDHTVRKRVEGATTEAVSCVSRWAGCMSITRPSPGRNGSGDLIPEDAEELQKGRVQIINLWRPIRGPLRDSPLAVCDARTVRFVRSCSDRSHLSASDRRKLIRSSSIPSIAGYTFLK